jgi:hypothetical protein
MSLLQKATSSLMTVSFAFFLLFLGLSFSSSYILAWVNIYILFFAGLIIAVSSVLNLMGCFSPGKRKFFFLQLLLSIVFGFILLIVLTLWLNKTHNSTSPAFGWQWESDVIRDELCEYANKNNGFLPDANSWRDSLLTTSKDVKRLKRHFDYQKENSISNMAFNISLSGANFKKLDGNIVLLFQTDSVENVTGQREMLEQFAAKNNGHVFVLFCDGTFADLDVPHNSLRFLSLSFQKDYLPLHWKPLNKN